MQSEPSSKKKKKKFKSEDEDSGKVTAIEEEEEEESGSCKYSARFEAETAPLQPESRKDALSGGSLTEVPKDSLFFVGKSKDYQKPKTSLIQHEWRYEGDRVDQKATEEEPEG
ncbi:hypothetical protein L1987_34484 [Smallanthus sonchifolius]|uniref:Uncharacterized protein n=1 Tax=Smallanthus sonchifolius TaxID=185202 RepID=A0ACB9HTE6_9ASTR|nr:hypothetical protein L1987_34484 [Smallanthus sonchifolius]